MSWTAEELAVLKARADEGLSSGQIAAFLPAKSRNAVIGMLKRGEGKYGALLGQPRNQARGRAVAPRVEKAATTLKARPARDFKGDRALARAKIAKTIPEAKASEDNGSIANDHVDQVGTAAPGDASRARGGADTAPSNLPAPLPRTFLDAMLAGRCLHYVGDPFGPDGPDMPVCGAERAQNVIETRYCRRHLIGERLARAVA
jgi:hypothetical protein